MSPTIYEGCRIEDEISTALSEVRKTFSNYEKATEEALENLQSTISELSGSKTTASVTIGEISTDNQIKWTAKEPGAAGNDISIVYQYLGPIYTIIIPITAIPRPPSAEVVDNVIYVTLAVNDQGEIDPAYDVATSLPIWLSGPGVSDLVDVEVIGTGSGLPEPTAMLPFEGGKDRPITDAENAAADIAKEFGHSSYQDMMRSLDMPVVENASDAARYLQNVDSEYLIVNKKLFLVEGTNLIGLRSLYNAVQQNIPQMKRVLALMSDNVLIPYMVLTQTVESIVYEVICGEQQPTTTLSEQYLDLNRPLQTIADQYAGGDISDINSYIFWVTEPRGSKFNYSKLELYGFSEDYITSILVGETPDTSPTGSINAPMVWIVEDPTLLEAFNFTDAEIHELLQGEAEGIRPPSANDPQDKLNTVNKLLLSQPKLLENGLNSRIKKPLAALQSIDMSETTNDKNLSKELSTRGKACARLTDNLDLDIDIPDLSNIPDIGVPDIPFDGLDQGAQKIESAFAALSNVANSASKLFDVQVGGLLSTAETVVNKMQNLMTLSDNLINNDLAKCVLGTGVKTTGPADLPSPGVGDVSGAAVPSTGIPDLGLPLPTSLLGDALGKLSVELDENITEAVESVMETIAIPLCLVRSLLDSINGFDLGGLVNPCKDGSNSDEKCPPTAVQEVINSSDELSSSLNSLPQTDTFNTETTITEVNESVEDFSGRVVKDITETDVDIDRGVQEVMDDIQKGINAKVEIVEKFTQAIRELAGDGEELANDAAQAEEEYSNNNGGCFSTSLGQFTDAIENFI